MITVNKDISELSVSVLDFLVKNPSVAASKLLIKGGKPLKLLPYQRIVLKSLWDNPGFSLLIMGRGMAKTFMIAVFYVLTAMLRPGFKSGIVSASYRQAQITFNEMMTFYDESPYFRQVCRKPPVKAPTECSFDYTRGGFAKALPIGDGSKIRGYRFQKLFIDEAAQVEESIIDDVLRPMLNVKYDGVDNQLIMASSANYQFNHIYKKYLYYKEMTLSGDKRYNLQDWTYHELPDDCDYFDFNQIEDMKRTMPRINFLMENENMFPSDSDGFYPASLIHSITTPQIRLELKGKEGSKYVLGIDPARESDNFACVILKLGINSYRLVRVLVMNNATFPEMTKMVHKLLNDYNIIRIAMDSQGGGGAIRDLLAQETSNMLDDGTMYDNQVILPSDMKEFPMLSGRRILDMVYFSSKEVNQMNMNLKSDMEHKRILFPRQTIYGEKNVEEAYDEVVAMTEEIQSVVATSLKSGYLHFDTPSKYQKKDRYSALLLAAKAAREVFNEELVNTRKKSKKLAKGGWVRYAFGRR